MRPIAYAGIVLLSGLMAVHVNGCSLILLNAGARTDAKNRRPIDGPPATLVAVPGGRAVAMVLADGDTVHGRFRRAVVVPHDVYTLRHAAWMAETTGALRLVPGERITLAQINGEFETVTFRAFAPGGVRVGPTADGARWIPYMTIASIETPDRTIDVRDLREADRDGRMPTDTDLEIAQGKDVRTIPSNQVRWVLAGPRRTHQWAVGLLAGATADYLVIVWIRDHGWRAEPDCDSFLEGWQPFGM
jgi:hypothetical protein